ncbi:MAG: hypothetical protein JW720_07775 [Sedimentisphaerales bacterium]|nr:hypothetical protein [Sedimentisphaerales bacterium]
MTISGVSRRTFLRSAASVTLAGAVGGTLYNSCLAATAGSDFQNGRRKLIVVLFGGGTRSSESVDDPEHRFIRRLWNEIAPGGTLFTNMRVEGKVVHPNSDGSIMTGHWEWDDIDWSRPVRNPTIFEIYRKAAVAEDTNCWAFVYASILAKTGESLSADYGRRYGANIVVPPTIGRQTAERMSHLMASAGSSGSAEAEAEAAAKCAQLARKTGGIETAGLRSRAAREFLLEQYESWMDQSGTTSHDAFLVERAIGCMKRFAPDVMSVCLGEIDCAHYGSWSRYVEAIRRTDELTWRLWRTVEELDSYKGRTLMLILPDHGRELDRPGHWGFIHHSDFYTGAGTDEGCRRVWMVARGPGVKAGGVIDRPVPITAAAATGLEFLDLEASGGAEKSVWNLMSRG